MTGSTSRTIHSGRVFEWMKPWMTLRRFESFFLICFDFVARICSCSSATVASMSVFDERIADGFGAHLGDEGVVAVFVERLAVLGVGEELLHLERGLARIDDHVVLVVDHALERARGHVEQRGRGGSACT